MQKESCLLSQLRKVLKPKALSTMRELPPITERERRTSPAPTPQANVSGGECGRPSHQRAAEFTPQKYYEMHVKEAYHSFHPELPTQKIWGYDGLLPGPTFVERYGVPITVRIYNDLPADAIGFGSPEISTHGCYCQ